MTAARLLGNGIQQQDLTDLILAIKNSVSGITAKLDADAGVTDVNYTSLWPLAVPSGIQTTGVKAIHNQGEVYTFIRNAIAAINGIVAKLDLDAGVADTNYGALWAISGITVGVSATDSFFPAGQFQSALIYFLDRIVKSINGVTAKLDADGTVTDTNFGALWAISDTVDEGGTYGRVRISGWIIGLALLGSVLFGGPVRAAEPFSAVMGIESTYYTTIGTVTFSAAAPFSFASNSHYRRLYIADVTGGTSCYYTLSTDTTTFLVQSVGLLIPASNVGINIESNSQINFQLPPGVPNTVYRFMQKEK